MNAGAGGSLLRFAAAGLLNTAVGLAAVFAAGGVLGVGAFAANAIGLATGFIVGYVVNRRWTFRSEESMAMTAPRYLLAFAVAYALNAVILAILLHTARWPAVAAQATALMAYSLAFYWLCRHAVFRAAGR
jgi:putative flippase GtrA